MTFNFASAPTNFIPTPGWIFTRSLCFSTRTHNSKRYNRTLTCFQCSYAFKFQSETHQSKAKSKAKIKHTRAPCINISKIQKNKKLFSYKLRSKVLNPPKTNANFIIFSIKISTNTHG